MFANTTTTDGHGRALLPKKYSQIDVVDHHVWFKENGLDTYFILFISDKNVIRFN